MKYALFVLAAALPLSSVVMANENCTMPNFEEQFAQLDSDADNLLSQEEFAQFNLAKPCADSQTMESKPDSTGTEADNAVVFEMLDVDASGTLDLAEFNGLENQ
jgi:Ca2+-binding EF-hand superfamily protein